MSRIALRTQIIAGVASPDLPAQLPQHVEGAGIARVGALVALQSDISE